MDGTSPIESSSPSMAELHDEKITMESSQASAGEPDGRQHHYFCDVENGQQTLYPITSYASQIGGDGAFAEEVFPTEEKDANSVDWDGAEDPANPYNW